MALRTPLPTLTRTPLPTLTPTAAIPATGPVEPSTVPGPELASSGNSSDRVAPVTGFSAGEAPPPASSLTAANGAEQIIALAPAITPTLLLPTASPTETVPTATPTATATAAPTPTSTTTPTPTDTPLPAGWIFGNVRLSPDETGENIRLYGDVLNNTGAAQKLAYITGVFYGDSGQVIANEDSILDYWPVDRVPAGGRVPFELTVSGIQSAADFDLNVIAEPSNRTPLQDFEVVELTPAVDHGLYCVAGRLRNPGDALESYLTVVTVLYDSQNNVINFSDYHKPVPRDIVGDRTLDLEICVDPLGQAVAHHELRAWGL